MMASAGVGARWKIGAAGIALGFLFVIPLVWLHRIGNRSLLAWHGTVHAGIAYRFESGQFPPENPFFAGQPLRYYWAHHYLLYMLGKATGLDPLHAHELCTIAALLLLAVSAVALGKKVFGSILAGVFIAYLSLAGANPLAPLLVLKRTVASDVHDPHWAKEDPNNAAVVSPTFQQAYFGDPRYGVNYVSFIAVTSRSLSLGLLVAMLFSAHAVLEGRGKIFGPLTIILAALGVCLNPLVGLAGCGALAFGMAVIGTLAFFRRHAVLPPESYPPARFLHVLLAVTIGVALATPTFLNLTTRSGQGKLFRLGNISAHQVLNVAWNMGITCVLAGWGFWRAERRERPYLSAIGIAALLLLAGTILVSLPVGNEHNLCNTALVFLAVPAGGMFARSFQDVRSRPLGLTLRAAALFGIYLPGLVLIVLSFHRTNVPIAFQGTELVLEQAESGAAELYDWVKKHTPPDAIFVVDLEAEPQPLCNVSDFPTFTRRVMYVDRASYLTSPYAEFSARLALAKKVSEGTALSATEAQELGASGRPVYLVSYRADDESALARLTRSYGEPLFCSRKTAVFSLGTKDK